ncbi:hypothetical protein [Streptomyces sp. bgisy034]|uniref:hypothetical protein n=1 Tax=Streptomyces sp. bgisy034 TaxID=3413774 RepID=UPI003EBD32E5
MPRIQILELPMVHVGDYVETPFAVIIDEATEETFQSLAFGTTTAPDGTERPLYENIKEQLGARAILAFAETIEIPANGDHPPESQAVHIHVDGDLDAVRSEIERMVHGAQHESALG